MVMVSAEAWVQGKARPLGVALAQTTAAARGVLLAAERVLLLAAARAVP